MAGVIEAGPSGPGGRGKDIIRGPIPDLPAGVVLGAGIPIAVIPPALGAALGWVPPALAGGTALAGLGGLAALLALTCARAQARRADAALRAAAQARRRREEAEARLADLADLANDWFWTTDEAGRIIALKGRFRELTGLEPGMLIGQRLADLCPGTDIPHGASDAPPSGLEDAPSTGLEDAPRLIHALESGQAFQDYRVPVRLTRAGAAKGESGTERLLRLSGRPICDDAGAFQGHRGAASDITAEQRKENALIESEAQLRRVIDLVPHMIFLKDGDGRFLLANRAVAEAEGVPPRLLIGHWHWEFHRDEAELAAIEAAERRVIESGTPETAEAEAFTDAQGRTRTLQVIRSPYPVGPDENAVLAVAVDITELKAQETELVRERDRANAMNRAKSEFLANMSHELRTPLNAVIGFSELMESELLGPLGHDSYRGYVQEIGASAHLLLGHIEAILELSRQQGDETSPAGASIDPVAILATAVREASAQIAEAGVSLEIADGVGPGRVTMAGETAALHAAFAALIDNAVKFNRPGGAVTVQTALSECGDDLAATLEIAIADTGIGIEPAEIPRLMDAFAKTESSQVRCHEGLGLGLGKAQSLIAMNGGQLGLDSTPGIGTTAHIALPVTMAARRVENDAGEDENEIEAVAAGGGHRP